MIVRNGWSLIALAPFLEPGLPGPAVHAAVRHGCRVIVRWRWGCAEPTTSGPAALVAVWIGVTVAEL